jgi:translation initiation factor 2D
MLTAAAVYALWLLPTLLPRIPTEAKLLASPDSALMSGSSLMVPGLLPPPNTYPESSGPPPKTNDFIAITAPDSDVPLVVGRAEMDVAEMVTRRAQGEKGKAIRILHTYWDELWTMGGKGAPPGQDALPDMASLSVQDGDAPAAEAAEPAAETVAQPDTAADILADLLSGDGDAAPEAASSATLETEEVDALLTLALLSAIKLSPPEELPVDASTFYSSHVLPNRPATWPPAPREEGAEASWTGVNAKRDRIPVGADADVRKSSAKKLAKWIKNA